MADVVDYTNFKYMVMGVGEEYIIWSNSCLQY